MGGANTQSQVQTTGNPALDKIKSDQKTDEINNQKMSGMHDESFGHYLRGGKQLVKEMLDPNYNRNVARPVSSYEAIDEGLK